MWRAARYFFVGIVVAGIPINLISVYLLHGVATDRVGLWDRAYTELAIELTIFAVAMTLALWLLTFLGRLIFRLRGSPTNPKLGFLLGLAVMTVQYPWDVAARRFFPNHSNEQLGVYVILSVFVCAAILVWDNFTRKLPKLDSQEGLSAL
ncbi:MAG TPA: hypothetical protein VNO13_03040 [Candidatus Udaeobacter sp.]|nr:hypothetical protein [Candidatus Udaeobacter sp.]